MKTYFLFLFILIGCSKTTVQPDITGHWIGASSRISIDMTIVKSSTGYNGYTGTGTYTIVDGCVLPGCPNTGTIDNLHVSKNVSQNIWIISVSHNTVNNNGPVSLTLNPIEASTDFNKLTAKTDPYEETLTLTRQKQ